MNKRYTDQNSKLTHIRIGLSGLLDFACRLRVTLEGQEGDLQTKGL